MDERATRSKERSGWPPRLRWACLGLALTLALGPTDGLAKDERGTPGSRARDTWCERKLRACRDEVQDLCFEKHRGDVEAGSDCLYEGFLGCQALWGGESRCRQIPRVARPPGANPAKAERVPEARPVEPPGANPARAERAPEARSVEPPAAAEPARPKGGRRSLEATPASRLSPTEPTPSAR